MSQTYVKRCLSSTDANVNLINLHIENCDAHKCKEFGVPSKILVNPSGKIAQIFINPY